MAYSRMHSTDAKRYVRIAQLAGVGLGVMAVALWAMDPPFLNRALPAKPEPVKGDGGESGPAATVKVAMIDRESPLGIQERMDLAVKRPVVVVKDDGTKATPPPPPPPPTDAVEWKYHGLIKEPDRTLALVSLDGAQRFIPRGAMVRTGTPAAEERPESIYQATLKTVTPEYIEFEDGKRKITRVDVETRTSRVSWVKPVAIASGASAMPNGNLSAEARARLMAGQIDPAQVERARQAAAAALAGRNRAMPPASPAVTPNDLSPNNGQPGLAPTMTSFPGGTVTTPQGSGGGTGKDSSDGTTVKPPLNSAKGVKAKALN